MESFSIVYPQENEHSLSFRLTNSTDTDQTLYLRDLTVHSFNTNIDWTNNCFSWVERRPATIASAYVVNSRGTTGENLDYAYVLCCLRIEPGSYTSVDGIIDMINRQLGAMTETIVPGSGSTPETTQKRTLPCALCKIEAIKDSVNTYAISEFQIYIDADMNNVYNSGGDAEVKVIPAILSQALKTDYPLNNMINRKTSSPIMNPSLPICVQYNGNGSFSLATNEPERITSYENAIQTILYTTDGLTKHSIDFDQGITRKMGIVPCSISPNALIRYRHDAIRLYDNGDNYSEFLLNTAQLDEAALANSFVNTIPYSPTGNGSAIIRSLTVNTANGELWVSTLNKHQPTVELNNPDDKEYAFNIKESDENGVSSMRPLVDVIDYTTVQPECIKIYNMTAIPMIGTVIGDEHSRHNIYENELRAIFAINDTFTNGIDMAKVNTIVKDNVTYHVYTGTIPLSIGELDATHRLTVGIPECTACPEQCKCEIQPEAYLEGHIIHNNIPVHDFTELISSVILKGCYDNSPSADMIIPEAFDHTDTSINMGSFQSISYSPLLAKTGTVMVASSDSSAKNEFDFGITLNSNGGLKNLLYDSAIKYGMLIPTETPTILCLPYRSDITSQYVHDDVILNVAANIPKLNLINMTTGLSIEQDSIQNHAVTQEIILNGTRTNVIMNVNRDGIFLTGDILLVLSKGNDTIALAPANCYCDIVTGDTNYNLIHLREEGTSRLDAVINNVASYMFETDFITGGKSSYTSTTFVMKIDLRFNEAYKCIHYSITATDYYDPAKPKVVYTLSVDIDADPETGEYIIFSEPRITAESSVDIHFSEGAHISPEGGSSQEVTSIKASIVTPPEGDNRVGYIIYYGANGEITRSECTPTSFISERMQNLSELLNQDIEQFNGDFGEIITPGYYKILLKMEVNESGSLQFVKSNPTADGKYKYTIYDDPRDKRVSFDTPRTILPGIRAMFPTIVSEMINEVFVVEQNETIASLLATDDGEQPYISKYKSDSTQISGFFDIYGSAIVSANPPSLDQIYSLTDNVIPISMTSVINQASTDTSKQEIVDIAAEIMGNNYSISFTKSTDADFPAIITGENQKLITSLRLLTNLYSYYPYEFDITMSIRNAYMSLKSFNYPSGDRSTRRIIKKLAPKVIERALTVPSIDIAGSTYNYDINQPQNGTTNPAQFIPFFPYSDQLYVRITDTTYVDAYLESLNLNDRIYKNAIATINVPVAFKTHISSSYGSSTISFVGADGTPGSATAALTGTRTADIDNTITMNSLQLTPNNGDGSINFGSLSLTNNSDVYLSGNITDPARNISIGLSTLPLSGQITDGLISSTFTDGAVNGTINEIQMEGTVPSATSISGTLNATDLRAQITTDLTGTIPAETDIRGVLDSTVLTATLNNDLTGTIDDTSVTGSTTIDASGVIGTIPKGSIYSQGLLNNIGVYENNNPNPIGFFSVAVNSVSTDPVNINAGTGLAGDITASLTTNTVSVNATGTELTASLTSNAVTFDTSERDFTINSTGTELTASLTSNVISFDIPEHSINMRSTGENTFSGTVTGTSTGTVSGDVSGSVTMNGVNGTLASSQMSTTNLRINSKDLTLSGSSSSGSATIKFPNYSNSQALQWNTDVTIPTAVDLSNIRGVMADNTTVTNTEYLYYQTDIQPLRVTLNFPITIRPNQSKVVYVTGNNQVYPISHATHTLIYSIV